MKKSYRPLKRIAWLLPLLGISFFLSCRKSNDAPVITRVRTLYKAGSDTTQGYLYTYTLTNGSVVLDSTPSTTVTSGLANFDSTTTSGLLNNTYVIIGQNLGSTTKVTFNGLSAYFNPALVSNTSIIVTIPPNTPDGPNQTNMLTVVTLHGTANFKFTIPFPAPAITGVSDYDFSAGSQLTLTGLGFGAVSRVGLSGTADTATILSRTDSVLTLKMPVSDVARTNLVFTYGTGTSLTSPQEFVDLDNAYTIFAFSGFQNGWSDDSWSQPSGVSTAASHSGTASAEASYPAGGWKIEGWISSSGIPYDSTFKYLTFWVKGGTVVHTLTLVGDQMPGGYSQNTSSNAFHITVPPLVWTYFKIPLAPSRSATNPNLLNFWANGSPAKQLGFFLQGQTGDVDETLYFDEVAFVR